MPRIANFTTTGQQVPGGGMTLAALMARQKELADRQASLSSSSYAGQGTIAGGLGNVFNQLFAGLGESRARTQETEGRAALAQAMSHLNPETGAFANPGDQATAFSLDPDMAYKVVSGGMDAVRRRNELAQGHDWDVQAAKDAAAVAAEAEAKRAGTAESAAIAASARQAAEKQREEGVASTEQQRQEQAAADEKRLEEAASAKKPQSPAAQVEVDYQHGNFGPVGSPEAMAARDAAVGKANYTAPVNPALRFTPGQAEADKKFAVDALEWKQSGGANTTKTIAQLNKAIDILGTPGRIGPSGMLVGLGDEVLPSYVMKNLVNPDGTIARDAVRESVQQTLKQTLGGQFTEKEAEALMNRAFDPSLQPAENMRRAKLILGQVSGIAKSKQEMVDYFDKNGTLVGYSGTPVDINALMNTDFGDTNKPPVGAGAAGAGAGAGAAGPSDDDLVKKYGGGG